MRVFAGVCLVANGGMLSTGTPVWVVWVFGAITAPFGFLVWHGLGARFGLSRLRRRWLAWVLLAMTVALCFVDVELDLRH